MKRDSQHIISKLTLFVRNWIYNTRFFRENYLILRELSTLWPLLVVGLLFYIGASLLEGVGIGLLLNLLQGLADGDSGPAFQTGWAWIDSWVLGVNQESQVRLLRVSAFILLTSLVRFGLSLLGFNNILLLQLRITERLRLRLFEQLTDVSISYLNKSRSGELVHVMLNEILSFRSAISSIQKMIEKGIYIPVYLVFMFFASTRLALLSFSLLLVLPLAFIEIRKRLRSASIKMSKYGKNYAALTVELISGIWTIKAFAAKAFERKRYLVGLDKVNEIDRRIGLWSALVEPLSEFLGLAIIIVVLYTGLAIIELPVPVLLTFVYVLLRLVVNSRAIIGATVNLNKIYGSAHMLNHILRKDDKPYIISGHLVLSELKESIVFENVQFGYQPDQAVLKNINLEIQKSQKVAFVGSSGSGKSTLVSLLLRLYDPTSGRILIDGEDIRSYDVMSLRRRIGVVSQDTFLFNASVRDNIAYGLEQIAEEDIIEAARSAYALEFIDMLPDGMDTLIGDRGVLLSGGQRQRIAIARALVRNPDILILDEATSALDNASEKIIQNIIDSLSRERTIISIAHRLSTIVNSDVIYVLNEGILKHKGKYQELTASGII